MQLYSIASGSSGNCIYIGDESEGILVDVGISMKRVNEGLKKNNLSLDNVKGIFITHEHSDHISGLGPVLRKAPIYVYATAPTISAIWEKSNMKNISPEIFHSISPKEEIEISNMVVSPFAISHDAAMPVCYTVSDNKHKVAVATDMGCYDDEIINNLGECDALLLEANHDINLLQVGPYPYRLKMRILGDKGHLSNDSSARLISEILHSDLKSVLLGHLSQENNFPDLAYQTVKYELEKNETWNSLAVDLAVANRTEPTKSIILD